MEREIRLKRLYFRSAHRGSKETDLILEAYARTELDSMSDEQLAEFEAFLDEGDNDIWDWACGRSQPAENRYVELIARLCRHAGLSS